MIPGPSSPPPGISDRGVLLVLSAPLGLGKALLCQALLDREPNLRLMVSTTTRTPREREEDGFDYFFIAAEEFRRRAEAGDFVEWVMIDGNFYGTARPPLEKNLAEGRDVLLNVDSVGAEALKQTFPDATLVFVSPPTWQTLKARLRERLQGRESLLDQRLSLIRSEMPAFAKFDHIVFSDDLIKSADALSAIVRAERHRAFRHRPRLDRLIQNPVSPPVDGSSPR